MLTIIMSANSEWPHRAVSKSLSGQNGPVGAVVMPHIGQTGKKIK
jgi:hypothetical protein